jgi:type IV pilus assembly protein PilA
VDNKRTADRQSGFTLVELLVVMVVVGILAGVAVPMLVSQKRKAREAAVKSDVKAIAKEVAGYYVDGSAALTLGQSAGQWQLLEGATVVASGAFSPGNTVGTAGVIVSHSSYCIAVDPTYDGARTWKATQDGLEVGDC